MSATDSGRAVFNWAKKTTQKFWFFKPLLEFKNWFLELFSGSFRNMILAIVGHRLKWPHAQGPLSGFYNTTVEFFQNGQSDKNHYIRIHPPTNIVCEPPGTVEEKVHWKLRPTYYPISPETYVALIPHGRVFGQHGVIISPDNKVIGDVSIEFSLRPFEHSTLLKWKFPVPHKFEGNLAVVNSTGPTGYFHWMLDCLPRLKLLQEAGIPVDKFYCSYEANYQKDSLACFGIAPPKIIRARPNTHVISKTLVVPSLPGNSGIPPVWACQFLREKITRHVFDHQPGLAQNPDLKRIYVSRECANNRKVENEKELVEFLEKNGVTRIFAENYSFFDQVRIFSQAEIVIAAHGAGLTNILFCKPGTRVIELFPPMYISPFYWIIARNIDLDYFYIIGEGERAPDFVEVNRHKQNYRIDIAQISKIL